MKIQSFLTSENAAIEAAKPFIVISLAGDDNDTRIERIAQSPVGFDQICHIFKMTFPPVSGGWRRSSQYAILMGVTQVDELTVACTFTPVQKRVSPDMVELLHIGSQKEPTIKPVQAPGYLCLEEFFPESFRAGTFADYAQYQLEKGDME